MKKKCELHHTEVNIELIFISTFYKEYMKKGWLRQLFKSGQATTTLYVGKQIIIKHSVGTCSSRYTYFHFDIPNIKHSGLSMPL